MKKAIHSFTTTWNISASAINWLVNKQLIDSIDANSAYQIKEGLIKMIIISIASSVEGSLRTLLYYKWKELQDKEVQLSKKKVNETSAEIIRERNNLAIKLRMLKKKGINRDRLEWSKLSSLFEVIKNSTMEKELNKIAPNLYDEIEILFQFRNFLVHSNHISNTMYMQNNSLIHVFEKKANNLYQYVYDNQLFDTIKSPEYITEKLLTPKLLIRFNEALKKFLTLEDFEEHFDLQNIIRSIY